SLFWINIETAFVIRQKDFAVFVRANLGVIDTLVGGNWRAAKRFIEGVKHCCVRTHHATSILEASIRAMTSSATASSVSGMKRNPTRRQDSCTACANSGPEHPASCSFTRSDTQSSGITARAWSKSRALLLRTPSVGYFETRLLRHIAVDAALARI